MPVVGIPLERLHRLLGQPVPRETVVRALLDLGCDIEGFGALRRFRCTRCGYVTERTQTEADPASCDTCRADFTVDGQVVALGSVEVVRLELLAVRPDIFDVGGLARAVRAYLELRPGLVSYQVGAPRIQVLVRPDVATPQCFRPSIACAVVREVELDEDLLRELMRLQENLHWALGRDRRRASIGVYDLDTILPPVYYTSTGPEEHPFVPLGWRERVPPQRVLAEHPKGREFAKLLEGFSRYPLLVDSRGQVLSMPPLINSEDTKVTSRTHHLLVDVTGPRPDAVQRCLNIMVTSILEFCPGSKAEAVEVVRPEGSIITPLLSAQAMVLDLPQAVRLLGFPLGADEAVRCLARMGHGAHPLPDGTLEVRIPAYRADFLHPRDLVEDLAIGYGYRRIVPTLVPTMTVGQPHPLEERVTAYRRTLVALGLVEVMSLLLGCAATHYTPFGVEVPSDAVLIDNPISQEQTLGRTWLLPGLMEMLSRNTSREMPQKLFEVGYVMRVDPAAETGASQEVRAGFVLEGPGIGFADIRSLVEALVREMGDTLRVRPVERPYFIPGRAAEVLDRTGQVWGEMGEVHPAVLEHFKLIQPVAAAEMAVI